MVEFDGDVMVEILINMMVEPSEGIMVGLVSSIKIEPEDDILLDRSCLKPWTTTLISLPSSSFRNRLADAS